MEPEKLAKVCRCGHARRFHQQGTIWQGYDTRCLKHHAATSDYYETGCMFFEDSDSVVVLRRGPLGRFVKALP